VDRVQRIRSPNKLVPVGFASDEKRTHPPRLAVRAVSLDAIQQFDRPPAEKCLEACDGGCHFQKIFIAMLIRNESVAATA